MWSDFLGKIGCYCIHSCLRAELKLLEPTFSQIHRYSPPLSRSGKLLLHPSRPNGSLDSAGPMSSRSGGLSSPKSGLRSPTSPKDEAWSE